MSCLQKRTHSFQGLLSYPGPQWTGWDWATLARVTSLPQSADSSANLFLRCHHRHAE
jgi:hypothetical protein